MNHALIVMGRRAAAGVEPFTIVAATGVEGVARQAAAATDPLLGVADEVGASVAGQIFDIQQVGLADVRAGGTFSDGDPLTADAQGRAIRAVPQTGVTVRVVGLAQSPAVVGDIVAMLLAPSFLPPPAA